MSHLDFKAYTGLGETQVRKFHYSQSVISSGGSYVHLAGQGGWDPTQKESVFREGIKAQVEQAFANVEIALKDCGATLDNVFEHTTYTVPHNRESQEVIVETAKRLFPDRAPLWTDIGVKSLGEPEMLVEIKVTAHIPAPSSR